MTKWFRDLYLCIIGKNTEIHQTWNRLRLWYNIPMPLSNKQIKQQYFDKMYEQAPWIKCACGCNFDIKSKDRYGRNKTYISGHNGKKYEDPKQYKREWNHRNKKERSKYKANWLKQQKANFINILGGKCKNCPLKFDGTNHTVFDFHHLRDKLFNISSSINKYSLEKLHTELEKCELLCANCHRTHHANEFNTADSE